MSDTRTYNSRLRQEQAEATREKILQATADVVAEAGGTEAATVRAVAARAGVREITVYRHFPNREILLQDYWAWMNRRAGVTAGMPESAEELVGKLAPLFASFDAAPAHVAASLRTPQGLAARRSLDEARRTAFLAIVDEVAPGLAAPDRVKAGAVLQLIYSGYAWISMREQWDLDGAAASEAAAWAVQTLLADLRTRGSAPIAPGETGAKLERT